MRNVVIVGSGPAGLTCAIYCARAGFSPVVFAGGVPGGQLITTDFIENFPGIRSISGVELMSNMLSHAESLGAEIVFDNVLSIKKSDANVLELSLSSKESVFSRTAVICTGSVHKHLKIPGEKEFSNKGVSWCATCDGPMFLGKRVVVVGGGNTAVTEALFLSNFVERVFLVHRKNKLRSDKILQDKVFSSEKIEVIWNVDLKEISGGMSVEKVVLQSNIDMNCFELAVEGVFVAIGTLPSSSFVSDLVDLDEFGYIKTCNTKTSCAGVFAAGDVVSGSFRQAVYSAGQGALASKCVEEYLLSVQDL